MENTILGLDRQKVSSLNSGLNELLANFHIYYQNLRVLHWNIKGQSFFELHMKFEELYTDAQEKIDMIVMATRGAKAHFRFGSVAEKVVKNASVPVVTIPPTI